MEAAVAPAPAVTRGAPPVLSARSLTREYGVVVAVDGIDLDLQAGDFLTVFGPNGAGKTTLLSLLGGRLRPTRGEVRVGGERLDFGETAWRSRIGVLSHQSFLYAHLTVAENLRFFGKLFGLRDLDERIPLRLEQVGLLDRADFLTRQLSHGMRQRAALARALLHDPELVLLDEPYTGLDPHAASVLRGVLSSLKDGHRTVVMVTHNLTQGLELANRIAIQVRGRFAWEGLRDEVEADAFEHFYHRVVEKGAR
ncbi:MAG: heme ABC exporter ATP-binding protein CcmA [Longimicrobiales bacterium]|nr:heme ABC exporter ATP-binding protein CcmA [Longimicrobiales bacterium]